MAATFVNRKELIKMEKERLEKEKAITSIFMDNKIFVFVKSNDTYKFKFYYVCDSYSEDLSKFFNPRLIINLPFLEFIYQGSFRDIKVGTLAQILDGFTPISIQSRYFLKVFNKEKTKYIYFLVEQSEDATQPTAEAMAEAMTVRARALAMPALIENIIKYPKLISKDGYDIYSVCTSYTDDVGFNCSSFQLEIIPDNKLVTVDFTQSFNQHQLFLNIIGGLDIQKLNQNEDEFFIRVNNEKKNKYIYFFLKKQQAAATSAFYKKKSMKKKSMKKKSMKKKSMKKKSMKKKF
jgi:hypothetical protein